MATLIIPTDAPAVNGPEQGLWTYADWELLPDDGNRYEVINGALYMTTAPSSFHQWIIFALVQYFGVPAKERGLGYAFTAPIGVLMPECDPVQPDFLFVRAANSGIITQGRIRGVPDLIVEVQSPGTAAYDNNVKLHAYARAGVPEYAIVKPAERTVSMYQLGTRGRYGFAAVRSGDEPLQFACLPDTAVPTSALFAGAPDTTL